MHYRRCWFWLAALAWARLACADQLSFSNRAATPGSSLAVELTFTPESGSSNRPAVRSAVRQYCDDPHRRFLAQRPGTAVRACKAPDLAPNVKRFLLAGLNQNALPPGTLITIFASINQSAPTGTYPLIFSNVLGSDGSGNPSSLSTSNGAVNLEAGAAVPLLVAGVLSSASLLSGPVAPGESITRFGSGIGPNTGQSPDGVPSNVTLGGVTAQFDGNPAPLTYAGPNQLNAVIPFEVFGRETTQLTLMNAGQGIASASLAVTSTAPAIFTVDLSGGGQANVFNKDGTTNSTDNPAARGSAVTLFATGGGQTSPAGQDGILAADLFTKPLAPVTVQIGGLNADISYAGAVPGIIEGIIQVNFVLPQDLAPGDLTPIVLSIGTASSQQAVTMAVR